MNAIKRQKLPKGKGKKILCAVMKDLKSRSSVGKKTYGEELHSENGRNSLTDLYQELLDAVQYCKQYEIEREEMITLIKEARSSIDELCSVLSRNGESTAEYIDQKKDEFIGLPKRIDDFLLNIGE